MKIGRRKCVLSKVWRLEDQVVLLWFKYIMQDLGSCYEMIDGCYEEICSLIGSDYIYMLERLFFKRVGGWGGSSFGFRGQ